MQATESVAPPGVSPADDFGQPPFWASAPASCWRCRAAARAGHMPEAYKRPPPDQWRSRGSKILAPAHLDARSCGHVVSAAVADSVARLHCPGSAGCPSIGATPKRSAAPCRSPQDGGGAAAQGPNVGRTRSVVETRAASGAEGAAPGRRAACQAPRGTAHDRGGPTGVAAR